MYYNFSMLYFLVMIIIIWLVVLQVKTCDLESKLRKLNKKLKTLIAEGNTQSKEISEQNIIENPTDNIIETSLAETISKTPTEENSNLQCEAETVENSEIVMDNIMAYDSDNAEVKNKNSANSSFESLFMGNIFNKIGAVAILIGICILVKLISSYIEFTDVMKISIAYFAGLGLLAGAFRLQSKEKMKNFAEVLMGTGFGTLLITTYCATSLMHLFSTGTATILASLIILATYFIADKQKTTSMLIFSLIGGYLNPFFVNSNINGNFLFSYLIFLNLLSLIFVYRNMNKQWINIINLLLSTMVILCYSLTMSHYSLWHCAALWGIYIIFDILMIRQNTIDSGLCKAQTYLNFAVLTILSLLIFSENIINVGYVLGVAAVIYLVLGRFSIDKFPDNENSYFYSMLISLFLSTCFILTGTWRISVLSVEALLIAFLSLKTGYKNLAKTSLLYFVTAAINVFFVEEIYHTDITPTGMINFLPPVLSGFLIAKCFEKDGNTLLSDIYKFLSTILVYIFVIIQYTIASANSIDVALKCYIYCIIGFLMVINFILFSKEKWDLHDIAGKIFLAIFIFSLFIIETINRADMLIFLNLRLIAYALTMFALYLINKKEKTEFLKYIMVILGFCYIHFESINIVKNIQSLYINANWLITLMWTLYSGIISLIGIFKNKKFLKISGIWLSIFVVIRLFMFDFAGLDMIFKLLAFLTLGIVLMVVSYYYNKKKQF